MEAEQWARARMITEILHNMVSLAHADATDGSKQIITPTDIRRLVQGFDSWLASREEYYKNEREG